MSLEIGKQAGHQSAAPVTGAFFGHTLHPRPLVATAVLLVVAAYAFSVLPRHHISPAIAARPQPPLSSAPAPAPIQAETQTPPLAEPPSLVPDLVRVELPNSHPPKKRALPPVRAVSQLPRFTSTSVEPDPKPVLPAAHLVQAKVQATPPAEVEVDPPPSLAVEAPDAAPPPSSDTSNAGNKHRNVVRRTLGKLFHGHHPDPAK